jgi:hypothetical protein
MTFNVSSDNILSNKSQSFSIVWEDDTDTICDLSCLLTNLDNFESDHHKADTTRSSTTNRSVRMVSNGVGTPSSLPSPSSLPDFQSPIFTLYDPSAIFTYQKRTNCSIFGIRERRERCGKEENGNVKDCVDEASTTVSVFHSFHQ